MTQPTLQGLLGAYSIQDVMSFLAQIRATGALRVFSPEGELAIWWERGMVAWSQTAGRVSDTGELLVQRGKIAPEMLAELRGEGSEEDLGRRLVELGHLEEATLDEVVKEKVCEAIYRLFLWSPQSFSLVEDLALPVGAQPVSLDVQGLLLEGARRCDEWGRLPDVYRNPGTSFELMAEPKGDDMISLSLDEWRHLYLVNGCRSLGEIWRASPLASDLEVSAILYGLASARLVRPRPQEERTEEPVEAPTAPSVAVAPKGAIETLSLEALQNREGEQRRMEDATTRSMPPSSIRRLTHSQIQIESAGRLVVERGQLAREEFILDGEEFTLGRAPDNDLVLPDGHVSGNHARITRQGYHYLVEDLGSANGILVQGREVQRSYLRGGERVEIYPYRFRFALDFDISEPPAREG